MNCWKKILVFILPALLAGSYTACSPGNASKGVSAHTDLKLTLQRAADWQIRNFAYRDSCSPGCLHDYGVDAWTNGTLYSGMLEWAKLAGAGSPYFDWLEHIGTVSRWRIPANFEHIPAYSYYHADELCIGQFYLGMYEIYRDSLMMRSTRQRVDWIMNHPPDPDMRSGNKQCWSWCDALFMAPAVYARLAALENDDRYLQFMDEQFRHTYDCLYDRENRLFFRDASYFSKKEQNGCKVFWGRGNGWVAAGLVNLLKQLPEQSAYRPFYEQLFKEFVPRLAQLQDRTGFWHASLLDPESYPSPETSATALITYALAYGIRAGLLPEKTYRPVLDRAWNALASVVGADGKVGWVQPIGADPKKVTAEMTAVYGVGAFLLAGTELYALENEPR